MLIIYFGMMPFLVSRFSFLVGGVRGADANEGSWVWSGEFAKGLSSLRLVGGGARKFMMRQFLAGESACPTLCCCD
jgi:hypothetical protein